MSKFFNKGDFRSGYYRDQTFMMAIGELSVQEFFAGLYAHTDLEKEPNSAGRQMGGHFSTKLVDEDGDGVAESQTVLIDDLPMGGSHTTRTVEFLPDGRMVISVGSTCNVCVEEDERRAARRQIGK